MVNNNIPVDIPKTYTVSYYNPETDQNLTAEEWKQLHPEVVSKMNKAKEPTQKERKINYSIGLRGNKTYFYCGGCNGSHWNLGSTSWSSGTLSDDYAGTLRINSEYDLRWLESELIPNGFNKSSGPYEPVGSRNIHILDGNFFTYFQPNQQQRVLDKLRELIEKYDQGENVVGSCSC